MKKEAQNRGAKAPGGRLVLRGALALVVGAAVAAGLLAQVKRPPTFGVPVLAQAVQAGQIVTAADLSTIQALAEPTGALTQTAAIVGRYAQVNLYPGETVTPGQIGVKYGAASGQVEIVVPVTAAGSALAQVGQTVAVYGALPGASGGTQTVTELVTSAKVIGVYTQAALAITQQAPGAPALVALAVTQQQSQAILPYEGSGAAVTLVALGH